MDRLIKKMKWNPILIHKTCNMWVFGRCQIVSHMTPPHPNSNTFNCNISHVKRKELIKNNSNINEKNQNRKINFYLTSHDSIVLFYHFLIPDIYFTLKKIIHL